MPCAAPDIQVAVIGAGPHGLAAGMRLRRSRVQVQVFGRPMAFWHGLPRGMTLRSNWSASNIGEPSGPHSLLAYQADTGDRFGSPVPLDRFIAYGEWFERTAVAGVDRREVTLLDRDGRGGFVLTLADGDRLIAERVVVACGIEDFEWLPQAFRGLPASLVSHTGRHAEPEAFAGRRVAVVGGGQSALGSAALMADGGAEVEIFIRDQRVIWLRPTSPKTILGPLGSVIYAPTDVGPAWYSRLVAAPDLFRRLPRTAQGRIAYRSIRPACSHQVRMRLDAVPMHFGQSVVAATPAGDRIVLTLGDGSRREFDHLMLGTGYRVDVTRYPFLAPGLAAALRCVSGYPVLRRGLESVTVPRLHFMGAPAAYSFGPIQRFVSGSWYAARAVAVAAAAPGRRRGAALMAVPR
jgi:FAD-dependent urate hydroxylase